MTRLAAAAVAGLTLAVAAQPAIAADTPVPILLYHHVAERTPSDPLYIHPRRFGRHLAALDRSGYTAVTLSRVWRHWRSGARLPAKPVVVSFDDGYADQYRNAATRLRRRGWPGVLFLQTARLDAPGGLSKRQVRRMLRDGWELGAHSITHADLTTLDAPDLEQEVGGSREALRRAFPSSPVDFFAYPYGRHDDRAAAAVRAAGFTGAATTRRGAAEPGDGAYALDRMVITGTFTPRRVLRGIRATSRRR